MLLPIHCPMPMLLKRSSLTGSDVRTLKMPRGVAMITAMTQRMGSSRIALCKGGGRKIVILYWCETFNFVYFCLALHIAVRSLCEIRRHLLNHAGWIWVMHFFKKRMARISIDFASNSNVINCGRNIISGSEHTFLS